MAMQGKIIKSIAGFYEVYTGGEIYRCRAKGVFRALGEKPLLLVQQLYIFRVELQKPLHIL